MNRILIGILVGGALGVLDGLTAWFTPEVRPMLAGIVAGSTVKGLVAGILIGLFARKVRNLSAVLIFGTCVGGLFALGIAVMQGGHYFAIILPGSLVGLLTGFATVRYGPAPQPSL
ncbi:MAG TPA: hypothetical protein VH083_24905 [Myxococcales bacterium]|jgi:hypothetical protein|nr:hypothetical protein [Myxococcales bacterium]